MAKSAEITLPFPLLVAQQASGKDVKVEGNKDNETAPQGTVEGVIKAIQLESGLD